MNMLESVFNHLVLPPKLPGQPDTDTPGIEHSILTRLIRACDTLDKLAGQGFAETWAPISNSLCTCLNLNRGRLEKASLLQEFQSIQPKVSLILHVVEQNAALIIRRDMKDGLETVIFEAFEASPSSENVLATENALQWDFPGRAAAIPFDEFCKESFRDSLALFLEQASIESVKRFAARSDKAKASVIEPRDTADPAVVTQLLMPLLEAIGYSVDAPKIRKRVRDDVNIERAELPWRRLPFWLILRVATQRHLCLALEYGAGRACYKFLICAVLAQLLEDSAGQLAPELSMMLKAKLCRRLAKLEMDKTKFSHASVVYNKLFNATRPWFTGIIEKTVKQMDLAWANFRRSILRPIPKLPSHADEGALHLSLAHSGSYLHSILNLPCAERAINISLHALPLADGGMETFEEFTDRFSKLVRMENKIETDSKVAPDFGLDCHARCVKTANSIKDIFTAVGSAYDSNPEQMSIFILNVFDLWINMDEFAVKACALLRDYHPVFSPELLDVLQLPALADMQRLQRIQEYLHDRCRSCRFTDKTIFSEPDKDCFAVNYLKQSAEHRKLQERIEIASSLSRRKKETEWNDACRKYDDLSQKISDGTCVCSFSPDGSRNVKGCTKCWHWRTRKRLKITANEDFLPDSIVRKAVIVFELDVPSYLAAYRNATWRIFCKLGHPSRPHASIPPVMLLKDCPQLKPFIGSTIGGVSIASSKKSFLQTHFKAYQMKVKLSDVLVPFGLHFSYFDMETGIWLQDLDKPLTFQHLCGIHIPQGLQATVIPPVIHPESSSDGPSSYEIVVSQNKCPSDMSVHEFLSYQRLLSGKNRRWLTMLVELGSSNLNFSTEDTMHVFNQLAVQAGPAQCESGLLRDIHMVFQDRLFCERLVEQIEIRLRNINSNWREIHCMEMLITLTLRLFSLASDMERKYVEVLLIAAREITMQWITCLRDEVRNAVEAAVAERAAKYGFWAALLCRRTFTIFVKSDSTMKAEDLSLFVQASVALQENLVVNLERLPQTLKNMLIRDVKMAYQIRSLIQESIQSNPGSLEDAIVKPWSESSGSVRRTFSHWQFVAPSNQTWVASIITTQTENFDSRQVVHYNFVQGQLLIDGKPLRRLPENIRNSENVKELFGDQHLLTYSSSLSGMSHMLAKNIRGHEVHFGLRGENVVIRAITNDGILEHIPRDVFVRNGSCDLPSALIQKCVHWLNLNSRCVEIRRKPAIWQTKPRDWILDVSNRRAQRGRVLLVDPHSEFCKRVAGIFRHFEEPQRLTIYQPLSGKLSVELRHLELSFMVNQNGLLTCRELHAEVDPNQDAGTLYGLESTIVLRDLDDNERRSIITPLGPLTYKRHGLHVAVRASRSDDYGRFEIDKALGRLSCPPEPRLLLAKAQFHAFTSFVLPDPLTGRSGTEEAIHTLTSGYCQPWTPLGKTPASSLEVIKSLSPCRKYYPLDKRRLQMATWDEDLTMTIQHDSYEPMVQEILRKSDRLQAFDPNNESKEDSNVEILSHLRRRGEVRRLLYERLGPESGRLKTINEVVYPSRDREATLPEAIDVYQIVRLVRGGSSSIYLTRSLERTLQNWKYIGGFNKTSETISTSLSNLSEDSLAEQWGSLVSLGRETNTQEPYRFIFRLALLPFGPNSDRNIIRSLAAFGYLDELKALQPPPYPSFIDFKVHVSPTAEEIQSLLSAARIAFNPTSKERKRLAAAEEEYRMRYELESNRLARHILEQWPNSELSIEGLASTMIDVGTALERMTPEWKRWLQNRELSEYVRQVQEVLDRHKGVRDSSKPCPWTAKDVISWPSYLGSAIPSLSTDLLTKCEPATLDLSSLDLSASMQENSPTNKGPSGVQNPETMIHATSKSQSINELDRILVSFAGSSDPLRQLYGNDLKESLAALKNVKEVKPQEMPPGLSAIQDSIKKARLALELQFHSIRNALSVDDGRVHWLQLANLWPCLTPVSILELLRLSSGHQMGRGMREHLVSYGLLITKLQRLHRIKTAQMKQDQRQLLENWQNTGHENWSPFDLPYWLLLEIDSNLLIRPEQVDVARAIISPASGSNSVLQMNMGKGKTSCIVPMAVAVLGSKNQLSRLIVPKALLLQTAQTIQARLGGLVGREVRHIPFTRRTPTTPTMLRLYSELHEEVLRCCGVVLTTPEHILSYKLSGLQQLADSKLQEARTMINFQWRLNDICRDVLDESDFTLAVKTQLIYPSGPQLPIDGHPHRWKVAQMLLSLVEDHLTDLKRDFPQGIEVVRPPQGFPFMHFLRKDVEDSLEYRIIKDICDGRTSFLRLADSTQGTSKRTIKFKVMRVLSEEKLDSELIEQVSLFFADPGLAFKNILLVRGLLLNRILLVCLKKRWNVQYGLHPKRVPVAVPFEAKGVPSEYAEFGHPDVAILFTCLAFYYSGLTLAQFREGLSQVLNSDNPAAEYDMWIVGSDALPEALLHWNVINPDDEGQLRELWQHLRLNRNVLDHYMNNFVFPVHAKQFGIKLQASGWDIPLLGKSQPGKEVCYARTTGFSGTNDNKMMLPLTIKQDDLPHLSQTNAEVLTYLLQRRNRRYNLAASQGKRLTADGLLRRIKVMGIRILIDSGAYILQMGNLNLVKTWLDIDTKAKGAVYFGDDNRAWVQYRGGKQSVPLLATPFAENLDECLVYLDEAHTRGVDLKLPQTACGALTLALGQTKDHTVQAAMRLRQLGTTQSVVFFSPPEVHQSILDVCKREVRAEIDSSHVVTWLLEQTCCANEQLQNLYLAQGMDFCRRTDAQWKNAEFLSNSSHREAYLDIIQQPERQTLEQMYGSKQNHQPSSLANLSSPKLIAFMEKLEKQRQAAKTSGNGVFSSALEEVEQEREVEFQVEEVREAQEPTYYEALTFPNLHTAILHFAQTGNLVGENGYEHVFEALSRTGIGQRYNVRRTGSRLFVSSEFMRTVKTRKLTRRRPVKDNGQTLYDNFMRPVEWILWNPSNETALIIISEEAELLIPIIRAEKQPNVHLIAYAAPVTKAMVHFNNLSYYVLPRLPPGSVVPDWFSIELGIFAGRLYVDFAECEPLKNYLELKERMDGAAPPKSSEQTSIFTKDPVGFLLEWLTLRRKGQDIMHTPMGYICHGRPLYESHAFFKTQRRDVEEGITPFLSTGGTGGNSGDSEDVDSDFEDE